MLTRLATFAMVIALLPGCTGNNGAKRNFVREVQTVEFSQVRTLPGHTEIDIRLPATDTTLGGTLFLPTGDGVFPVVILQPGSQPWQRTTTVDYPDSGAAYYNSLGVGAWSYDKRGVGQSGGVCCQGKIKQLAADVLASIDAVSLHPQVDVSKIGIDGVSQGGWVAINTAARSADIAYVISKAGPAVSIGEEKVYSRLTGDSDCKPSGLTREEIDTSMAVVLPAGYDPRVDLAKMNQPAIWFYGGLDTSIPVRQSIEVLEEIKVAGAKNWKVVLQPDANHFMVLNGGPCQGAGERADHSAVFEDWLRQIGVVDTL